MNSNRNTGPARLSRLGGLLYLLVILAGLFGIAARWPLGSGDPAVVAAHVESMGALWRAAFAVDLAGCLCAAGLAWILYRLLRVVDRNLARLMLVFEGVAVGLRAAYTLALVAALPPLGAASLHGSGPASLAAFSDFAVRVHDGGFAVVLLFLGSLFLIRGRLIERSTFLPRWLGIVVTVSGFGHLANGAAVLLAPAIARPLFVVLYVPMVTGHVALCLWLLLRGVDDARWRRYPEPEIASWPAPESLEERRT